MQERERETLASLSPTPVPLKELATWLKAEMERCDDKALIHQDCTEHQRRNQLIGDDDLRQNQQIRLHWAGKKAAFAEVLEAVVSALSPHPPTSEALERLRVKFAEYRDAPMAPSPHLHPKGSKIEIATIRKTLNVVVCEIERELERLAPAVSPGTK